MKKQTLFQIAAITLIGISPLIASDDLDRLNKAYKAEVEKATEPITERYLKALNSLKERFVKEGKLHEAVAVEQTIAVFFLGGTEWKWDNTGKKLPQSAIVGTVKFNKNGTLINHKGATTTWVFSEGKLRFWDGVYTFKNGVWEGLANGRRRNYLYPATMEVRNRNNEVSIFLENMGVE